MKKISAMTGIIMNPEKPEQSVKELRAVDIQEVMFDFATFISVELLVKVEKQRSQEIQIRTQKRREEYFHKVVKAFASQDFLPTIARLPFTNTQIQLEAPAQYEELNRLTLQVNRDCIAACEELGCTHIIVQPLFAGVERGQEWEVNKAFYLTLAKACKKTDTRLLLINQCRDWNGHLVRGVCSDGVQAASWVDALNQEAGMERFGFCLDTGICNLCGQNMQNMIAALGDHIQAVILTENDGQRQAKLLPFTNAYGRRSTMDWLSAVRGLRELSYDGYLILETVDTTVAFSPLLQPYLYPLYKAILDYFEMQIAIERDLKKYEHIVLFGAGNMCRNYIKCYGETYPPLFTCDNNPKLWGTVFEGISVKDPEELKHLPENSGVIICNIFYREIEAQLREMGITNIGYFNDEYMPSFYFDRLQREEE